MGAEHIVRGPARALCARIPGSRVRLARLLPRGLRALAARRVLRQMPGAGAWHGAAPWTNQKAPESGSMWPCKT